MKKFYILVVLPLLFITGKNFGQTNNYFGISGTLTNNVWNTSPAGPYTSALVTTGGPILNFNNAGSATGGTISTAVGINFGAAITWSPGGTIGAAGINLPISVVSGVEQDFGGSQSFSTSATAAITKNGTGGLASTGGAFGGGFTLNAGTLIARGINAMGVGPLIINGGVIAANASRDFTGKYSSIAIGGNFTLGASTGLAATGANLIFTANAALGAGQNRIINLGGTGTYLFTGPFSGAGSGITLTGGAGVLRLTNATNSYTGTTTISGGDFRLAPAGAASFASSIKLNGGILSTTGIPAGAVITNSGTLELSASSTINLATNVAHTLKFAASNLVTWGGTGLTIYNWAGTPGASGTAGKIFVGTSTSGLTAAQLAKITFFGFTGGTIILASGEIVPSVVPTLTASPTLRTGFTYAVGFGPSVSQSFTISGVNLTGFPDVITVTAPASYEVSTDNANFFATTTVPYTTATLGATPLFVRLKAGLPIATYNEDVICSGGGATTNAVVNCNGAVTNYFNSLSDVIAVAASESATVSSTDNTPAPLTSATGTKVWDITIRDIGGATPDALPTIVNSIVFAQAAGNAVSGWSQAIKTISLFDGATLVATGTVTATQVQFTGMSYSVPANQTRTLAVRLSLNCGIGGSNKDGDDFGFSLSNANFTTASSATSSQKTAFTAAISANGSNVIEVVATQLVFGQQPVGPIAVNNNFSPAVTVLARDNCGNIDLNFSSLVSITSDGTMLSSPQTAVATAGVAVFPGISFTAAATARRLTATFGLLTQAISNPFDVVVSTNLYSGDLMLVGFDTYVTGGSDKISIANFVPVLTNSTFTLANVVYDWLAPAGIRQDRWYNGNSGSPFTNGPPFIKFTYTGAGIPSGSIICVTLAVLPVGKVNDITINGVSSMSSFTATESTGGNAFTNASNVQISSTTTDPDCLFLMQGDFVPATTDLTDASSNKYRTFTGRVFGGVQFRGSFQPFSSIGNIGGPRVSRIHPSIECIAIQTGLSSGDAFYGYYNAASLHTGSQRSLIKLIADFSGANWTTAVTPLNTDGDNLASNGASGTCNTGFTVTSNVSPGSWVGDKNTDWFNCSNWDDFSVPTSTVDVLIAASANNNAVIDCNASTANQFGNVADVKSLNITGKQLTIKYTAGTFINTLNVAGNLTLNTSNPAEGLNMDDATAGTNDGVINVGGNWTNNFSTAFKSGESLINFNSAGIAQTITTPDGEAFNNLTNSNSSLGLSLANSAANVTVKNILSLSGSALILNTNTLTLNGTVIGVGTITGSNNSNLIIGGTTGGSLGALNFTAGGRLLDNFTLNRTGLGATALLGTDLSVKTLATITAGIFDAGTNTFNGAGGLTMTGGELQLAKTGVTLPELGGAYALTGGVVNFKGAAVQTVRAVDYFNLTSTAAGTRTLVSIGTIGVANLFTPGINIYTVTGSTVDFNGLNTDQTIPAFTFYNVGFKNAGNKTLGGAINVQKTLTMAGNTAFILGANNVTLKSVTNLTANVATVPGSAAIDQTGAGRFIIERYVDPLRSWRFLTAPINTPQTLKAAWMEGATPSTTSPFLNQDPVAGYGVHISGPIVNGFDETPLNNYSIKYHNGTNFVGTSILPASTDITSQQGWMLFVRGDRLYPISTTTAFITPQITTLRTQGRINVGDISKYTIPVTPSGFSALGNPYPSAIDFSSIEKTGAGDVYYIWDPKLTSGTTSTPVGGWIAMTRGTGTTYIPSVTPVGQIDLTTGRIESGVAIMVSSLNITDLTIKETHKSNLSATFFRPLPGTPAIRTLRTRLNVRSNDSSLALFDGSLHIFDKNYSNAVNGADAIKPDNIAESFGIIKSGKVLAIEKASLPKASDTIFFKMSKMKVRNYTLEFIIDNVIENNLSGFVEDTYLKTKTSLNTNGSTKLDFTIINEPGSFEEDRFRIVFKKLINYANIKATVNGKDVLVDWNVESEREIDRYEIERSTDGESFIFLTYKTMAVNTRLTNLYSWVDINPGSGVYYYRVKGIDKSGAFSYSDVVKVNLMSPKSSLYVFPNPVSHGNIGLQFNSQAAGKYGVRLLNALGQVVLSKQLVHAGGTASHNIAYATGAGNYLLEVMGPDKKQSVLKVQMVE